MSSWFKDFGKKIGISVVVIVAATVIATLLLTLVEFIPYGMTERHMSSAINTISNSKDPMFDWASSQVDYESDCVIMSILSYDGNESPLNRAMMAYRHHNESLNYTIYSCYSTYLLNNPVTETVSYARYWHGYQLTLKPLFAVFDYSQLRVINLVMQILGTMAVCFLMYRKGQKNLIVPYVLSYLFMMPITVAWCLHYYACFWGATLGTLAVLYFYDKKTVNHVEYIFLGIGMFTCFNDLLSYPLITFGLPVVVMLSISTKSLKEKLLDIFKSGFFWCMGYGLFWVMKWITASILTDENIILDGINTVLYRTSSSSTDYPDMTFTPLDAISDNFHFLMKTPASFLMLIFVAVALLLPILKSGLQNINKKWLLDNIVPLLIICIIPLMWYSVVVNHSMLHNWFAFRAADTTLFALMASVALISSKMLSKSK